MNIRSKGQVYVCVRVYVCMWERETDRQRGKESQRDRNTERKTEKVRLITSPSLCETVKHSLRLFTCCPPAVHDSEKQPVHKYTQQSTLAEMCWTDVLVSSITVDIRTWFWALDPKPDAWTHKFSKSPWNELLEMSYFYYKKELIHQDTAVIRFWCVCRSFWARKWYLWVWLWLCPWLSEWLWSGF